MTDIPEDIMSTAIDIFMNICAGKEDEDGIAKAILAERQACEKVARDRAEYHFDVGFKGFSPSRQIMASEAIQIAVAIENRSKS